MKRKRISQLKKEDKEELIILIREMELKLIEEKKKRINEDFEKKMLEEENKILKERILFVETELIKATRKKIFNDIFDSELENELEELKEQEKEIEDEKYEKLVKEVGILRDKGKSFSEIRSKLKITNSQARNFYAIYKSRNNIKKEKKKNKK